MPAYISELDFYGNSDAEFIEIAVPVGTDAAKFSIVIYDNTGQVAGTYELGAVQNTMAGHDVYVVDDNTPGFATSAWGGRLYLDYGVALVDPNGDVLQFVSYLGDTVTAVEGPAAKMTSVDIGSSDFSGSVISEDGGATYKATGTPTKGSIPACYATTTLIATPAGPRPVEQLRAGDTVLTRDAGVQVVRWVWSGAQPLGRVAAHQKPVLISKGALGNNVPDRDLIVSGQHRIVVGIANQMPGLLPQAALVPAKALTHLAGIRLLRGKKHIQWHHFACDRHVVVMANGAASESLLPGPMVLRGLSILQRRSLVRALAGSMPPGLDPTPALTCLDVAATRQAVTVRRGAARAFARKKPLINAQAW